MSLALPSVKEAARATCERLRRLPPRSRFLFGRFDPLRAATTLIDQDFAIFEDYSDVLQRARQGEAL